MAEFRGAMDKFYTATRAGQGAAGCLYYGSYSHALARTDRNIRIKASNRFRYTTKSNILAEWGLCQCIGLQ